MPEAKSIKPLICIALMLFFSTADADSALLESQRISDGYRLCSFSYSGGPYIMKIDARLLCPKSIYTNMLAALTIGPNHPDHPANKK